MKTYRAADVPPGALDGEAVAVWDMATWVGAPR